MTHSGADAPHWHHFKKLGSTPNDWSFRYLEELSEDEEVACLETDEHRIVIRTQLVQRDRTADRYVTLYYEPADTDPLDEEDYEDVRVPFYQGQGMGDGIARNNVSHVRMAIDEGADDHVVVVEEDGERNVYDVPAQTIAEKAADLYTRIKLDTDRDVRALTYTPAEWDRHLEIEQAAGGRDD